MKSTFILAKNFNVTPFEIMAQDIDEVILVLNYLIESGKESRQEATEQQGASASDREQAQAFWACL